jgi:hypothetical protein
MSGAPQGESPARRSGPARPTPPRRRVLLCGPGWRLKFETFFHVFDKALLNGLCRAGHHVRHFSDRDTADAVLFGWRQLGRPAVQRGLRRAVELFEPDILLLVHADLVELQTLRAIRRAAPALIVASVDCDPQLPAPRARLIRHGPAVDATFVTSGGAILAELRRRLGTVHFVPNPLDPAILDPARYADMAKTHDLVYPTRAKERFAFTDAVRAAAPELSVLEIGRHGPPLYGRPFERALSSARAALNKSAFDHDLYSSDRVAQLFGLGLCVCMSRASGYRALLGPDAALWHDGPEDLAAQLREATASGRWAEIARTGRAAYLAQFDSALVADYIVARLTGSDLGDLAWAEGEV